MKPNSKTKFGTTHINMIDSVVTFVFATANSATTQSIKAWDELMLTLQSNLLDIENLKAIVEQIITGIAAQKKDAKTTLVDMSATIMRSVYAYAVSINNDVLAKAMYINRSQLKKKKYSDLVTFTQGAINTVSPIVTNLADYNVTPQIVSDWQDANTLLNDLMATPNNVIAYRVSINKNIQKLLVNTVFMLDTTADGMALNFLNNPKTVNYYNNYLANRKLKPYGHVPTQLRATTVDELDAAIDCNIQIEGTKISVNTVKGYANVSKIPFGEQKVIITLNGKTYSFGPYHFKKGKSLSIKFTLVPQFEVATPPPVVRVAKKVKVKK